MTIDVEKEAEKIAEELITYDEVDGEHCVFFGYDFPKGGFVDASKDGNKELSMNCVCASRRGLVEKILPLVTRAVADAKREQMEADVDAVLFHSCDDPPETCGSHHYVHAIRAAFAATEPRDAGKETFIAVTTAGEGLPGNKWMLDKQIVARQRFDKAAVELAKAIASDTFLDTNTKQDRLVEELLDAARELGIDGDA